MVLRVASLVTEPLGDAEVGAAATGEAGKAARASMRVVPLGDVGGERGDGNGEGAGSARWGSSVTFRGDDVLSERAVAAVSLPAVAGVVSVAVRGGEGSAGGMAGGGGGGDWGGEGGGEEAAEPSSDGEQSLLAVGERTALGGLAGDAGIAEAPATAGESAAAVAGAVRGGAASTRRAAVDITESCRSCFCCPDIAVAFCGGSDGT